MSSQKNISNNTILPDEIIRVAFAGVDTLISVMAKDSTILYANEAHEKILLYKPEEMIGKRGFDFIHPDDKKSLLTMLAKYLKKFIKIKLNTLSGNKTIPLSETVEYRVKDKSGNWHWLVSIGTIADGKLYNISRDITERKKTEFEISEQNKYNRVRAEVWKIASNKKLSEDELIQRLLNIIGPAIGVSRACYNKFVDVDINNSDVVCKLEWCNKRIKPSLGAKIPASIVKYLIEEDFRVLTLDNALDLLPEEMKPAAKPLLSSLVKNLNIESIMTYPHYINNNLFGLLTFDICKPHKGEMFWSNETKEIITEAVSIVSNHIAQKQAESELQNYQNNLETLVQQRTSDLVKINKQLQKEIAERKRTQEALKLAEKMEIIGLMASGVAHDLNNILSGIVTCPDMLLLELSHDSPHRDLVLAIKTSGLRAVSIVQDLLTLSKGGYTVKETICINDVVSDYQNSLEFKQLKESRPSIEFVFAPDKEIKNITASFLHVSKVIMNIVLNAADAIPDKGEIKISTKNIRIQDELKGYETIPQGWYVVLGIADTGKGIPEDNLQKIFEPFYTKKIMKRKGTGLGLAIVWKTVKDHNGYIDVKSAENEGTRFDIYFPAEPCAP